MPASDNIIEDLANIERGDLIVTHSGFAVTVVASLRRSRDPCYAYPLNINAKSYTNTGVYFSEETFSRDIVNVIKKLYSFYLDSALGTITKKTCNLRRSNFGSNRSQFRTRYNYKEDDGKLFDNGALMKTSQFRTRYNYKED